MQPMRVLAFVAIAACGPAPTRDFHSVPFPTLEKDKPPSGVTGLIARRYVTQRNAIALELGSEDNALLAFACDDSEGGRRGGRPDLFAPPRPCYRCALAMVDRGPQDPYGP